MDNFALISIPADTTGIEDLTFAANELAALMDNCRDSQRRKKYDDARVFLLIIVATMHTALRTEQLEEIRAARRNAPAS